MENGCRRFPLAGQKCLRRRLALPRILVTLPFSFSLKLFFLREAPTSLDFSRLETFFLAENSQGTYNPLFVNGRQKQLMSIREDLEDCYEQVCCMIVCCVYAAHTRETR